LLAMSFSANARLNFVLPWRFLRSRRPDSRSSPRYLQGNDQTRAARQTDNYVPLPYGDSKGPGPERPRGRAYASGHPPKRAAPARHRPESGESIRGTPLSSD
jgi:hypothetical protein